MGSSFRIFLGLSSSSARALLLDNPRKILKDEPITLAEPEWF